MSCLRQRPARRGWNAAPNPASAGCTVSYVLPRAAHVRLSLLDVQGREVWRLEASGLSAGRHLATLDAGHLAPGLYVMRMAAGGVDLRQRAVIVR